MTNHALRESSGPVYLYLPDQKQILPSRSAERVLVAGLVAIVLWRAVVQQSLVLRGPGRTCGVSLASRIGRFPVPDFHGLGRKSLRMLK